MVELLLLWYFGDGCCNFITGRPCCGGAYVAVLLWDSATLSHLPELLGAWQQVSQRVVSGYGLTAPFGPRRIQLPAAIKAALTPARLHVALLGCHGASRAMKSPGDALCNAKPAATKLRLSCTLCSQVCVASCQGIESEVVLTACQELWHAMDACRLHPVHECDRLLLLQVHRKGAL